MNPPYPRLAWCAVVALASLHAGNGARADEGSAPSFGGVLMADGQPRVLLIDSGTKHSSGWLRVGQHFGEYEIESYDPKKNTVTLTRAGRRLALHLMPDAAVVPGQAVTLGNAPYHVIADRFENAEGKTTFTGNVTLVGDGRRFTCDALVFDPAAQNMILTGNVLGTSGILTWSGQKIVLWPGKKVQAVAPTAAPQNENPTGKTR